MNDTRAGFCGHCGAPDHPGHACQTQLAPPAGYPTPGSSPSGYSASGYSAPGHRTTPPGYAVPGYDLQPPGYGQAYGSAPVPTERPRHGAGLTIALAAALVAILTGVGVYTFTQARKGDDQPAAAATATAAPPPAAVAPAPRSTVVQEVAPAPVETRYVQRDSGSGAVGGRCAQNLSGGYFSGASAATGSTSCGFVGNVGEAYNNSGARGASTTLYGVYSSATGRSYTMYCDARGSRVKCTGGNNAGVWLY